MHISQKPKDYKEPLNCYEILHCYSQNLLCDWNTTTYVFLYGRNKTSNDADVIRKKGFQLKIRYKCETKEVIKKKKPPSKLYFEFTMYFLFSGYVNFLSCSLKGKKKKTKERKRKDLEATTVNTVISTLRTKHAISERHFPI